MMKMTSSAEEYWKRCQILQAMTDEEHDSDYADTIRDEMDPLWYKLSEEEIAYIEKMICDESCKKYGHDSGEPEHKSFACLTCGSKVPYNVRK